MGFIVYSMIKFVCPVGALTSKPYVFGFRPWELKNYEVFNPTFEFYQPILIQVANNVIQRVLPSNSKFSNFYYNWISNRSRFFFEAFSELNKQNCFPQFSILSRWKHIGFSNKYFVMSRLIRKTWLAAVTRVSLNLVNYSSFGLLVSHSLENTSNLDLFTEFEFKDFCIQFLGSVGNFNLRYFYSDFKSGLVGLLNQEFQVSQILVKSYAQIFLISFNPHFLSPVLDYYLREAMNTNSTVIYTVLFSYAFGGQVFKNCLSTVSNLMSLFSGKHRWSPKLCCSTSLVIIDLLFVKTLPVVGMQLILKFIQLNSLNVYLVNTHVLKSLPMESQVSFVNCLNYSKIVHLVSVESNMFLNYSKIFNYKKFCKQFFLTGLDYSYIFNCEAVQFSEVSNFFDDSVGFPKVWFPVFAFISVSTIYKFFNDLAPHWFTKVVESDKRSSGQLFYLFSKRISDVRGFTHFYFWHMIISFFMLVILCQYFISQNFFEYVFKHITVRNLVSYRFGSFIFSFQWYFFGNFYFRNYFLNSMHSGNMRFKNFGVFSTKWMTMYYTTNVDLVSLVDFSVKYSKTLSLDKVWRVSRFTNFVLILNKIIYIYIYNR